MPAGGRGGTSCGGSVFTIGGGLNWVGIEFGGGGGLGSGEGGYSGGGGG